MLRNALFISYNIPPNGGIGGIRSGEFIKFLPEFGWRPAVLTSRPCSGRPVAEREDRESSVVYHMPMFPREKLFSVFYKFRMNRLVPFLYSPDPEMFDTARQTKAGIDIAKREGCTAIYSTSAPRSSHVVARNVRRATGLPWVADFRDPWVGFHEKRYPTPAHRMVSRRLERTVIEEADTLVANTSGTRDLWVSRYGEGLRRKIVVIPNGYSEYDFAGALLEDYPAGGQLNIASVGTIYGTYDGQLYRGVMGARFPTEFFVGLRQMLEEQPELRQILKMHFVGHFDESSSIILDELGIRDVVSLHGSKSKAEAVGYMRGADALVLIPPSDMPSYIVPSRAYEYLRAGKPMLALVGQGDTRAILEQCGSALFAEPQDVQGISRRLSDLVSVARARPAMDIKDVEQYDRRNLTRELARVLSSLTGETEGSDAG